MKISFPESESRLREALVQLIWDQWVSIGVAGGSRSGPVPFAVDPEALLLATTRFAPDEPRLLHEVADWLVLNGKAISLQRLKNLHAGFHVGNFTVLLELAEILSESHHRSWKTLFALRDSYLRDRNTPAVFPNGPELRGLSRRPDSRAPEAFFFKMRSLFGVNARAEVFTWLLTHDSGYPAEIARETGWFSKSIQAILNDLEQSGLVDVHHHHREKRFRLDRERWRSLLVETNDLRWFNQSPFYQACSHLTETLAKLTAAGDASDRMRAVLIREGLSPAAIGFETAGIGHLFRGHAHLTGGDLIQCFADGVDRLRTSISTDIRRPVPENHPFVVSDI